MFDTFFGGLAIGLIFGVVVNVIWGVAMLRQNDEWAEECERHDREWQAQLAGVVIRNYCRTEKDGDAE